jgi:hypothetical protein
MGAWLRLVLVIAHLGAAALPCAEPAAVTPSPVAIAAGSGALHTHGAPHAEDAGELRAPCSCGCDEAPPDPGGSTRLGAALLPAPAAPLLLRAGHERSAEPHARHASGRAPEPVPRLA